MTRAISCKAALLCVLTLIPLPVIAADELLITRAAFAGGVAGREADPLLAAGQQAGPGSLWFWTEIRVAKSIISELRQKKLLPLQHRWYRTSGGIPGPDEIPDFVRNLEELDDRKIEALAGEADSRGYFTYRTASCRQSVSAGTWVAALADAKGNPVGCSGKPDCRFSIRVTPQGKKADKQCLTQ
ncbi:hypothetical protein [Ferrovibrio sp.]|uniref:hypothetical protein n=1 Tax=Ferrovibrio sp. TaxID=1917215 RepID=UPI0025BE0EB3|nr:hypothetical protein [Ferrovibrio sp.]